MRSKSKLLIDGSELLEKQDVPILIRDKILLSPGTWNDSKYKSSEIENAYLNTNWDNKSNFSLYLDHKDTTGSGVANWVGYVKNVRVEDRFLLGDLEIWNPLIAMYLTKAKARFGISATLKGFEDENNKEMKNFHFESFSVVTDPACKDAYINLSQNEKSNERRFKIITMAEDEKIQEDESSTEEAQVEETEAENKKKKEEPEEEGLKKKEKYPYPYKEKEQVKKKEKPKEEEKPEEEKMSESPAENELSEEETMSMLATMTVEELSAWTDFVKKMKAKYPKMSFKAIAKAFKSKKESDESLEQLSDDELLSQISQRHEILRRRSLYKNVETPEEKVTKLETTVKELQSKINEGDRKTLSVTSKTPKAENQDPLMGMADFVMDGGQGTFTI